MRYSDVGASTLAPTRLLRAVQVSLQVPPQVHPTAKSTGRVSPSASISSPVVSQKTSQSVQHIPHRVIKLLIITTRHLLQHYHLKDACRTHSPPRTYLSTLPFLFCNQDKPASPLPGPVMACTWSTYHLSSPWDSDPCLQPPRNVSHNQAVITL